MPVEPLDLVPSRFEGIIYHRLGYASSVVLGALKSRRHSIQWLPLYIKHSCFVRGAPGHSSYIIHFLRHSLPHSKLLFVHDLEYSQNCLSIIVLTPIKH